MHFFKGNRSAKSEGSLSQKEQPVRPLRLLVAEDNAFDVECVKTALEGMSFPHEVTVADNGETAREHLLQWSGQFDLVLLDVHLPRLSGLQALHQVPGHKRVPVCFVTGTPMDPARLQRLFRMDRIPCIEKPIDREKLLSCLRRYAHLRAFAKSIEP